MTLAHSDIYIGQCNPVVGDVAGNVAVVLEHYQRACEAGAALAVFPEMCITGYPAEDLLLLPHFLARALEANTICAEATKGQSTALIIGNIHVADDKLYNAAYFFHDGTAEIRLKSQLPNEGVFDEYRYFTPAPPQQPILWRGISIALMVCADLWNEQIAHALCAQSVDMAIIINGSPFEIGKDARRKALTHSLADTFKIPALYVNMIGGQDELVFDGGSYMMDANGNITHQAAFFADHFGALPAAFPVSNKHSLCYQAMMMGLRDYVHKSGFTQVLIGLSGGIDSALTACVAADALGADNVRCVMLPSPYTSTISLEDAATLAKTIDVQYDVIAIQPSMDAIQASLSAHPISGIAGENIQSRIRGVTLMALSNSYNALLLTTGNKSEMAVGYATLYGDMCGAYNPLKDLYKIDVFALSEWRNKTLPDHAQIRKTAIIPQRIITRPPSAELRDNQKDEDSLPPYDMLDAILYHIIEDRYSLAQITKKGFDEAIIKRIFTLMKQVEYKRRQAPIGTKLYPTSFGKDWRFPLASGYTNIL
jgi:NAD+ synthase